MLSISDLSLCLFLRSSEYISLVIVIDRCFHTSKNNKDIGEGGGGERITSIVQYTI